MPSDLQRGWHSVPKSPLEYLVFRASVRGVLRVPVLLMAFGLRVPPEAHRQAAAVSLLRG